jgi:surface protein
LQSDVIFGATGRTYLETATSARQFLIDTYNWTINDNGLFVEPSDARFITIWDTTLSAPTNEVRFYIYGTGANFYIDWGDGNINYYPSAPGTVAYTYATPGVKTITFIGEVPAFDFCQEDPLFDKIIEVVQWGTNAWQDMDNAFNGCTHLVSFSATDAPNLSQVTNMQNMFAAATNFNGDINHWDVSNVTNMGEMFFGATAFNQPLNDWDVSSVTDMTYILGQATAFNQDLSQWDISNAFFDWIGFDGTSLSTSNYTKILLAWSQLSVQNNSFGEIGPSGNLTPYCSLAQSARDILEGTYGWGDWTDGGSVPCKTATYTAGAGGTLSGDAFQYVVDGEGGSAVTAVPQSGYRFVSWSDGSTENPRTDMNLASNLSVTAMFVVDGNSSEGTRIGARAERLLDVLSGIPVVGSIATFVTSVRDFLDYLTEHEDEIDDLTQEERTTIIIALRDILAFLLRFVPGV